MANKKITELTEVTTLPDAALLTAVDSTRASGDQNVKITKANLAATLGGTQDLQDVIAADPVATSVPEFEGGVSNGNGTVGSISWDVGTVALDTASSTQRVLLHPTEIILSAPSVKKEGFELVSNNGNWNATTNSPTLANTDTNKDGLEYVVSVAGSVDFGAGSISFGVGDVVANNGTNWYKKVNNNQSGSTPDLQDVTDIGSSTTNNLQINGGLSANIQVTDTGNSRTANYYPNSITYTRDGNLMAIQTPTLTDFRTITWQDGSGTVAFLSDIPSFTSPVITAYKTADQTITLNDTLFNDSDLTLSLEANSYYEINILLLQNSGASADFKTSLSIPSGATGSQSNINNANSVVADSLTAVISVNGFATDAIYRSQGIIKTTSAGNLIVQWAQNNSSSQNTTLREGSYIKAVKLN